MNIENLVKNNNNINNKNIPPTFNKNTQIDFSGLGILFGLAIQSIALFPLIFKVSSTKNAETISFLTPILFLFSFILFSIISFTKKYYLPLIIFFIGIVSSSILLVQKYLYEKQKDLKAQPSVFDLKSLNLN